MKKNLICRCTRHLTTATFFCLLVVCAVFSSCGDDDEEENVFVSAENINGIWELKNEEGYEDGEYYSENKSNRYYEINIPNYREIRKDRDSGEWEVRSTQSCSIDMENQILTIGYYKYKIQKLTSNTLQLRHQSETGDWWQIQTFKKADKSIFEDLGIEFD